MTAIYRECQCNLNKFVLKDLISVTPSAIAAQSYGRRFNYNQACKKAVRNMDEKLITLLTIVKVHDCLAAQ